ncbi:hypothetical protein CEXT_344761 [Caerostris extrusa]|uniref:Secreted protein n=1 Tax=Caerostris extrusa TaxID=172846 RepID=A0AAV4P379_CAEEX|nr:hypothetical protein CEXT_344761 [Caerostris extrusa]
MVAYALLTLSFALRACLASAAAVLQKVFQARNFYVSHKRQAKLNQVTWLGWRFHVIQYPGPPMMIGGLADTKLVRLNGDKK